MKKRKSRALYEVNSAPRTIRERMKVPALVSAVVLAGPLAGAAVIGTGRLMLWMAGAEWIPSGLLAAFGFFACVVAWYVAGVLASLESES